MSRSHLKRACKWTSAAVLFIAAYFASFPFTIGIADRRYPAVVPYTLFVYRPAFYYSSHHRIPGAPVYNRYCRYCMGLTNGFLQVTEPEQSRR